MTDPARRLPLDTPPRYCTTDGTVLNVIPIRVVPGFDPVTGDELPDGERPGEARQCARDASHPSWLRVGDEWRRYP